jgi:ABC-type transport system involved in cytochrome c biogenesis permease subunit
MSSKILFPAFVVMAAALYLTAVFIPPADEPDGFHFQKFGMIPVQESGRIMPFDTFAEVRLLVLGHKGFVNDVKKDREGKAILDKDGEATEEGKMPRIAWALDTMLKKEPTRDRRFIRIDSDILLSELNLDANRHGLRFSILEIVKNDHLQKDFERIQDEGPNKSNMRDAKIVDLMDKLSIVSRMFAWDDPHMILPNARARAGKNIRDVAWPSYQRAKREDPDDVTADPRALEHVDDILRGYYSGKAWQFNAAVDGYLDYVNSVEPGLLTQTAIEARFNWFAPFYQCAILFGVVFLLGCLSWIVWNETLANAAFALGIFTAIVYTVALGFRIWLSGYAPVTNLYSSAIFIGWGAALLCLGLEAILRNGIGSVLAAALAFQALIVAMNLVGGDTMEKLVAVLESNFWLSTHVTCVTFGYMATFVAGFLGIAYVLLGILTDKLRGETGVMLVKVTYGVICFATLLSFVGTVLGGIWADQSWGRFWGWDPKENGALLIVIWNAIILHARWGGLVKSRGVALLAIGGNMVTAWSWFGVNLLGVGLHNYGFMKGVMTSLIVWWVVNAAIIAIGLIPQRQWASFTPQPRRPNETSGPMMTSRLKPA